MPKLAIVATWVPEDCAFVQVKWLPDLVDFLGIALSMSVFVHLSELCFVAVE